MIDFYKDKESIIFNVGKFNSEDFVMNR